MRHATVIGGRGFVGGALLRRLAADGWVCQIVGRSDSWPTAGEPAGTVFYCAGLTADFLQRPFDTVEAHVSSLARALQAPGLNRLIYVSSTRLYDDLPGSDVASEQIALPVRPEYPRHLYDLTKLAGESLCHVAGAGRACVARLSSVYRETGNDDGFLGPLLQRVANVPRGSEIVVESSPHLSRDYIHIDDVVEALLAMGEPEASGTFNVASGSNLRNHDLAAMLMSETGRRLVFTGQQAGRDYARVDVTRLRRELDIDPRPVSGALSNWFATLS